ncbi:MAG: hypothetical protein AAGA60_01145 [Cyanobacteria bacterium P01_E01_bin.42]
MTILTEEELPQLWILTPSASDRLLDSFGFARKDKWEQGIYFLPEAQKTALIAINRLSETPETLWLRILGKGKLQERAILELIALKRENPLRIHALEQVAIWRVNLQMQANPTTEQQELMMALPPAYLQWREEAVRQGQRMMLESVVAVRFGSVDEELAKTIDRLLELPSQEAVSLVLQCTREELLERLTDR